MVFEVPANFWIWSLGGIFGLIKAKFFPIKTEFTLMGLSLFEASPNEDWRSLTE
jgi:hypothetical protein